MTEGVHISLPWPWRPHYIEPANVTKTESDLYRRRVFKVHQVSTAYGISTKGRTGLDDIPGVCVLLNAACVCSWTARAA
jgi:hypothetical protein